MRRAARDALKRGKLGNPGQEYGLLLRTQFRPQLMESDPRPRVVERHRSRQPIGEQSPYVESDERREERQIIDPQVLDFPRDVVREEGARLADLPAQGRALPVILIRAEIDFATNAFFDAIAMNGVGAQAFRGGGHHGARLYQKKM